MGLLDFDDHYKPPFERPKPYKPETGIDPLLEINNLDRKLVTEDYGDSVFADRKDEVE
jgi:hypothetical protein